MVVVVCDSLMMVEVSNGEERSVFFYRRLLDRSHYGVHMDVEQDMMTFGRREDVWRGCC